MDTPDQARFSIYPDTLVLYPLLKARVHLYELYGVSSHHFSIIIVPPIPSDN